jgi:protocatechuate 3,4-dioxygenase beta subunit
MKNPRRQFLKNTGLATLFTGLLGPTLLKARPRVNTPLAVDCDSTTLDLYGQGPFYTPNAPTLAEGMLAGADEAGTRLVLSGRVVSITDCMGVVQNAEIDVWHANDAGSYDNNGFNLRGKVYTNEQGYYLIETILPGKYLNGNSFRPRHIHFRITPPGFSTLITQLYFEGDTSIPGDAAASVTSGNFDATARIIPLTESADGQLEGVWDVYIEGDGVTAVDNVHLDKGIIYTLSPNPFRDRVAINYGVFQRSRICLTVHDMQGRQVAVLEEKELLPEKYTAIWEPPTSLPAGHYFVALKVNDLQVHYLRVVRQ